MPATPIPSIKGSEEDVLVSFVTVLVLFLAPFLGRAGLLRRALRFVFAIADLDLWRSLRYRKDVIKEERLHQKMLNT